MLGDDAHELLNIVYRGAARVSTHLCGSHTLHTSFRVIYVYSHTLRTYAAPRYTSLYLTCISHTLHTSIWGHYIILTLYTLAPRRGTHHRRVRGCGCVYTLPWSSWVWVRLEHLRRCCIYKMRVCNIGADVDSGGARAASESVGCEKYFSNISCDVIQSHTTSDTLHTPGRAARVRHARVR